MENDLTLILETKNHVLLNMVREALENQNIPALLKSATGYYLRGMLPIDLGFFNLRLYVQNKHLAEARDIVKTIVPPEEM